MQEEKLQRIQNNPKFQQLVATRNKYAWTLSAIMLAIYFGFILTVAFAKDFLAASLVGGLTSVGMPIGVGVIASAFVLTGLYVRRANTLYDELTRQVIEDLK